MAVMVLNKHTSTQTQRSLLPLLMNRVQMIPIPDRKDTDLALAIENVSASTRFRNHRPPLRGSKGIIDDSPIASVVPPMYRRL